MQKDIRPDGLVESAGTQKENMTPAKRIRNRKEREKPLTRGDEGGEKPFRRTKKTLEDGKTYVGGRVFDKGRKPVRKELASKGERKTVSRDNRIAESGDKPVKIINRASKDDGKVFTKSSRTVGDRRKPLKKAEKTSTGEGRELKLERKSLKRVGKSRVTEGDKPAKKPIYGYGDKKAKKATNTGRTQNSRKSDWTVKDTEQSAKPSKNSERLAKRSEKPATGTGYRQEKPKNNSQGWPNSKGRRRVK